MEQDVPLRKINGIVCNKKMRWFIQRIFCNSKFINVLVLT
jgi:hypothetical protein